MKTENQYIFTDIPAIVKEKERLSEKNAEGKWSVVEYKAGEYEGKMIVAPECVYPEKLTLKLNLEGIYRIYLCFPRLRSVNYFYAKLSDEVCYTGIRACDKVEFEWQSEENFEEIYWKSADLTGKDIVIAKPDAHFDSVASLAFIRCERADESELSKKTENRCMQMHFDEDMAAEDVFENEDDYLVKLYQLKNTNVDFLSFEFSFDFDKIKAPKIPHMLRMEKRWDEGMSAYIKKADMIYKKSVSFAHEMGFEIFAANRCEVGNFSFPYSRYNWNFNFPEHNPELYIRNRDKSTIKACSYAYEKVQEYVIGLYIKMLQYGFDGITLILHRGAHIGFESPVIERFSKLYPDVNPYQLPLSDERLHGVLSSFMNEFMEKLRSAVDEKFKRHIKINVITDYGLYTSKIFGLDVENWAKCGYIDSVAQGDMEMYEVLEGCMCDDNPGLIDLEKYGRVLKERAVIQRNFATNVEKVLEHIPEYAELSEKYGVQVYNVIPWTHTIKPEEYEGIIERMKKAGAKKFLSWNTNHLVWDLPEWHTVSKIGNDFDKSITYRKIHRTLSLDGNDVSQLNVNWRG